MIYEVLTNWVKELSKPYIEELPIWVENEPGHFTLNDWPNESDHKIGYIGFYMDMQTVLEYKYSMKTNAKMLPHPILARIKNGDIDFLIHLVDGDADLHKLSADDILRLLGLVFFDKCYKQHVSADIKKRFTYSTVVKLLTQLKEIDAEEPDRHVVFSKQNCFFENKNMKISVLGSIDGKYLVYGDHQRSAHVLYRENAQLFWMFFDALHTEQWDSKNTPNIYNNTSRVTTWELVVKSDSGGERVLAGDATSVQYLQLDALMDFATALTRFERESALLLIPNVVI